MPPHIIHSKTQNPIQTMKRTLTLLILLTAACTADSFGRPPRRDYPTPPPRREMAPPREVRSDYLDHLAREYRNGWRAGRADRFNGWDRDYRRAYEIFGRGWESYFQEGYADGYEGRCPQH